MSMLCSFTDARRALLNLNNLPAQHVFADDLPLPELPSVISTTGIKPSSSNKSGDLSLQYSIEEEDAGNSLPRDAADDIVRQSKSEC